jgi:hypothetical protein
MWKLGIVMNPPIYRIVFNFGVSVHERLNNAESLTIQIKNTLYFIPKFLFYV